MTFSYGREERVMLTGTLLPEGAPKEFQDPKVLFNAIEKYEVAENARTAKKIMVALPKEFDFTMQKKAVLAFATAPRGGSNPLEQIVRRC